MENHVEAKRPESIVELRLIIDSFINSVPFLHKTREVSLTHTNLQRAFMWLGMVMKEMGGETPYVNSENPQNDIIEKQAEKSESTLIERWKSIEDTHTARVKDFRWVIGQAIGHYKHFESGDNIYKGKYSSYLWQSKLALMEAKMWLGWELARIKQEKESKGQLSSGVSRELPL